MEMVRTTLVIALMTLGALGGPGAAQEKPEFPTGLAPRFVAVEAIKDRDVLVREIHERLVPRETAKVVERQGKVERVTVVSYEREYRPAVKAYPIAFVQVYDAAGKQLSAEEALKRLTPGTVMLVAADGKRVDPAYLRIVRKDALILVLSPPAAPPADPTKRVPVKLPPAPPPVDPSKRVPAKP